MGYGNTSALVLEPISCWLSFQNYKFRIYKIIVWLVVYYCLLLVVCMGRNISLDLSFYSHLCYIPQMSPHRDPDNNNNNNDVMQQMMAAQPSWWTWWLCFWHTRTHLLLHHHHHLHHHNPHWIDSLGFWDIDPLSSQQLQSQLWVTIGYVLYKKI